MAVHSDILATVDSSHFLSMLNSQSKNNRSLQQECSTAVNGLKATLQIVNEAAGTAKVPKLRQGIRNLLFVLDVMKKTSQHDEDVKKLSAQIEEVNEFLEKSKNTGRLSSAGIDQIDHLFIPSNKAIKELRKKIASSDRQLVNRHIPAITWSIQNFKVETVLAIEFAIHENLVRIGEKIQGVHETTTGGFQQVDERLDIEDGLPPHAKSSPFDGRNRAGCLEGTRKDILGQIFDWAFDSQSGDDNTVGANARIFWITGPPGKGKTTIAYDIAKACETRGILGASFFCSRDDADCSNPNLIFTSIAHQLGIFSDSFRTEVTGAMEANPDISYAAPSYQLEELIIKPLRALGTSFPPCVIVLDALDECKDSDFISVILSSLSLHVNELSSLKILVTSRPAKHIIAAFESTDLSSVTQRQVLVEPGGGQGDIECYFSSKLASTRELYHLESDWPSTAAIHALTGLASGLFIFAAISVRFIEDRNYSNPKNQLARFLSHAPTTSTGSSSPNYASDQLYAQVLNHAFPNISPGLSGRLKMILGTIVLLRDPLPSLSLEQLLGLNPGTARETLERLHSIVVVPDDDAQVIRMFHSSFFDFITNPTRCLNPVFLVNPRAQHTLLARACLNLMKELRRDICGIRNPSLLNSEIKDLPGRIMTCIPPQLQYACRHWTWHLSNAMFSDILLNLVEDFCSKYLLYWVEALSLMGDLRNALLALVTARHAIAKSGRDMTDSIRLCHDCERLILQFSVIGHSSLQIYHSGLLFTPSEASIKKTYAGELDLSMKMHNAADQRWNPWIQTMEGHNHRVKSAAFSPDGRFIVSGSDDKTLRLWDASTGGHLITLGGHSDWVNSVAFSPRGGRIVSGSDDCTVRLWDSISGAELITLVGHFDRIKSVAFSPDGMRVASGSSDNTVRVWDAISGAHLNTLEGHSSWVVSVAFSPDGTRIASGCDDETLGVWDAVSGVILNILMGHSSAVNSVAFSPDSKRIVSASSDETLRLWDAASGAHLITLEGHSEYILSVAFSPNGMRIVSGSSDKTIRLWDAVSGMALITLEAHSSWVTSVAFSLDSMRIVSTSNDRTLRLWDAVSGAHLNIVNGHTSSVESVAFSADGTRVASGSDDCTIFLWDSVSGVHLNTLKGHSSSVDSVAFSPDGTRIVSGSSDNTVRLWDAMSGALTNTLKGHSSWVDSVAFSPDGMFAVSASLDKTVRLWDAVSGANLNILKGHTSCVNSVAFSPDGTRIVSGSTDKTIRMWDGMSGAHLSTLVGHSSSVDSVAFSSDGTRIVSGSHDGILRLWDAADGTHLTTVNGHSRETKSVARSYSLSQNSSSTPGLNPVGPIFGYIADDGWVHSFTLNRRICWMPASCTPKTLDVNGNRVVFGREDGRVMILDLAGMGFYFCNL